nr:SseB family protein [Planosporangium thailandense]
MRDTLRAGDQESYFRFLARTELILPVDADAFAGRAPMAWGTWITDSRTHVLAFTSPAALRICLAEHAGTYRTLAFQELADSWPDQEWWLAVNPGLPIEGYLPPWFVLQISRGDVSLPGRTLGARARIEHANALRSRAVDATALPGPPTRNGGLPSAEGTLPNGGRALSRRAELLSRHGFGPPGRQPAPQPGGPVTDNGGPARSAPGNDAREYFDPYRDLVGRHTTDEDHDPLGLEGGADGGYEPLYERAHEPATDLVAPATIPVAPEPPSTAHPEPAAQALLPEAPAPYGTAVDVLGAPPGALLPDALTPLDPPLPDALTPLDPPPSQQPPVAQPEPPHLEAPQPEPAHLEASQPEPAHVEAPQPEPAHVEPPPDTAQAGFTPANEVESALLDAASEGSTDSFLSTLLLAKVLMPGPAGDPLAATDRWYTEEVDGQRYAVVFTSDERLREHLGDDSPASWVRFTQLISSWPGEGLWFAVNPGSPIQATLPGVQILTLATWAAGEGLTDERPEPEVPAAEPEPLHHSITPPPAPGPVLMQKTISAQQVPYYLDRGYDRVSGFVHRASEVAHLRTPPELYNALGLGYSESRFSPDDAEVFVLRWAAYRGNLYRIPYGGQNEAAMQAMQGWVIERPPFRGNGFAPSESRDVIAEFKVDSVRLPHGAELWRLDSQGTETLVARFDADGPRWQRVDEQ